jgi:hypothetical protein
MMDVELLCTRSRGASLVLAQLPDAQCLCSLPKTRLRSGIPACLKLPTCLFLLRSSKVATRSRSADQKHE